MNKQIEALKMAIYSFEKLMVFDNLRAEIQICKEALAEAKLNQMQKNAEELGLTYCKHGSDSACKECYMEQAEQQEWQSLSDDDIQNIMWPAFGCDASEEDIEFARAIEQALKEKNHG